MFDACLNAIFMSQNNHNDTELPAYSGEDKLTKTNRSADRPSNSDCVYFFEVERHRQKACSAASVHVSAFSYIHKKYE